MPLSRKNYLKKSSQVLESDNEKGKNEDLFDKLLSSPMKQEVNFQPLSYWKNNVQTYDNSKLMKKTKKNACWLYESSDSDASTLQSPAGFDNDPKWSSSESESLDNQTVLDNPLGSPTNNTNITDFTIDNISTSPSDGVNPITNKLNEMRLSSISDSDDVSDGENSRVSEKDITIKDLTDTTLLLDSRLVTKRRNYNNNNSSVIHKTRPRDAGHSSWMFLKSLRRKFQYSDESFIPDSKIFASTSQCHILDEKGISPLIRNRHVAIRKRHESSRRFREANTESHESFDCSGISTASSLGFIDSCSVASSDVEKEKETSQSEDSLVEDSQFRVDTKIALKPGKKWKRSISVIKNYGNKCADEVSLQNSSTKGKKYKDFVESVLDMQRDHSKTLSDISISNVSVNFRSSEESFTHESEEAEKSVNNTEFSKSVCDETFLEKTFLNRTVKVTQLEGPPSTFRSALGLEQPESFMEDTFSPELTLSRDSSIVSAKDFILALCNQEEVLIFENYFNERTLKDCKKIGEGVYGEVFRSIDSVIKVIPIEGSDLVNDEKQKTFEEIISEVVIASKLSSLKDGQEFKTSAFTEMKRCWCVKGKYPRYLIKLWEDYDTESKSENDSPVMFKEEQLYIVLELCNGGKDLESFIFKTSQESLSIFIQTAFGLAVAEKAFEFEHRDLHWGNILVSKTDDEVVSVVLQGVKYEFPSRGVKVCIIDFTLSRISHDGCSVFNNLSLDPDLFSGVGDYQFDIYRIMLQEVNNDWSLFKPKNNLYWLHYVLDKMITMVHYKSTKGKVHYKGMKGLKSLKSTVLKFNDSTEFVTSDCIKNLLTNE